MFGGNSPNTVPLLDMVLAKHGADFTALETTRTDRAGYTGAMSMAELGDWEIVLFLLDDGCRPAARRAVTLDGRRSRAHVVSPNRV